MSYAVRNDGQGFRAVNDERDVLENEFFSVDLPPDPVPLPPTEEELIKVAKYKRDEFLSLAALRLGPLKDAEEDGVATEEELAKLKLWKDYRISLNRIEGQEGFPNNISWPKSPEA